MSEVDELRKENDRLRAALAVSKDPCLYCNLPASEWSKCASGFPGCARGDDAMLCPGGCESVQALQQRIADLEWELMLHQTKWARAPKEAMWRATDDDGNRYWFDQEPMPGPEGFWFLEHGDTWHCDKIAPPADFTQTLEPRPVRVTESTSEAVK